MKKNEAIKTINMRTGSNSLNNSNTHFANVNTAKNVWWFDIPTSKAFSQNISHLHLLVYQNDRNELYHLKVPTSFFIKNKSSFIVREEKKTISLELSAYSSNFLKDVRPGSGQLSFDEFLQ